MRTALAGLVVSVAALTTFPSAASEQAIALPRLQETKNVEEGRVLVREKIPVVEVELRDGSHPAHESTESIVVYHRNGGGLSLADIKPSVPGDVGNPAGETLASVEDANGRRNVQLIAVTAYESNKLSYLGFTFEDEDEVVARDVLDHAVATARAEIRSRTLSHKPAVVR